MQKHEDLKAARNLVGLSQAQAAKKAGVSRVTYSAWETGKSPVPEAKYAKFLEAIGKTQEDVEAYFAALPQARQPASRVVNDLVVEEYLHSLPRAKAEALCASILRKHPQPAAAKVEYDRKGYPLGVPPFGLVEFEGYTAFEEAHPGVDLEEALIAVESSDFPVKERIRAVKATERRWPNNKDEDHLGYRARKMREWDAENAPRFTALALEYGWPVDIEQAQAVIAKAEAEETARKLQAEADRVEAAKREAQRLEREKAEREAEARRIKALRYDADGYPQGFSLVGWLGAQEQVAAGIDTFADVVYLQRLQEVEGFTFQERHEKRDLVHRAKTLADEELC